MACTKDNYVVFRFEIHKWTLNLNPAVAGLNNEFRTGEAARQVKMDRALPATS